MSEIAIYALTSVSLVSVISLTGVFAIPIQRSTLDRVVFFLLALATGAMLGNALFNLLPEAFEKAPAGNVWMLVLSGLVFCFFLEWGLNLRCHHSGGHCRDPHFHSQDDHHDDHSHSSGLIKSLLNTLSGPVLVVAAYSLLQWWQFSASVCGLVVGACVLVWFAVLKASACRPCAQKANRPCCGEQDEHKVPPGTPSGHIHATGWQSILAHAMDNFMDGVLIAVSYQVSIEVGMATTLAIVLHEIPMEFGGFGVLVNAGFSRWGAIGINLLSAGIAALGTGATLFLGNWMQNAALWLTPLCAGIVLHITLKGLFPQLQAETDSRRSIVQFVVVVAGMLAILAVHQIFPE